MPGEVELRRMRTIYKIKSKLRVYGKCSDCKNNAVALYNCKPYCRKCFDKLSWQSKNKREIAKYKSNKRKR